MVKRHYNDYFKVPANYKANMTREAINETPETWLDFYPHPKYLEFLNTLFDESKSVWLTGNYGTGKSNAALVTHKLFMDDMHRVDQWFKDYEKVIPNCDSLRKRLLEEREAGTLVIYDYNASGIGPNEEFLVRLEKGIQTALKEKEYEVPANANIDIIIERLRREGNNFFNTRDQMLGEMRSLKADIQTVDQLIGKLKEESGAKTPTHYLDDVQAVLHKDSIYLDVDVPTFRSWIREIIERNSLKRIIYIFDEFSEFIDSNSGTLKTFEDVTEAPDTNHFYLVPVTHKELSAFYGEKSPGAKKARDRFYFRNLQMPNDIAFKLTHHAMKDVEEEPYKTEWKEAKDMLWNSIVSVVDRFNDPETSEAYVSRESFYNILPIHPMAAFLLKFLAESARSNQRSIFEYLKGSADGREFQEFIEKGGPQIMNRQFLTVDYLWKYFMEREDSGQSKEIINIKTEYDRIKQREFHNYDDEQPEIRVLKTVMLFTLLSKLNPEGHDRLRPTTENIELSFRGDGVVVDVDGILRDLSDNRHCFSVVNGNIDLYSSTVGNDEIEKVRKELSSQFHELLSPTCKSKLEEQTKSARRGFSGERFEIRVSDVDHTSLTNISASTREKFSRGNNKDDGSICLWFVVAKNRDEQMKIPDKQDSILAQLREHRIVMINFPDVTFCAKNTNLWEEYVNLQAQYRLENNTSAKTSIKNGMKNIEDEWIDSLKSQNNSLDVRYYDLNKGAIISYKSSWTDLKGFLERYAKSVLEYCPDLITDQVTAFGNKGIKTWATAGITFDGKSQQAQLINSFKAQGVEPNDNWFDNNPNHLFSKIRTLLQKKYDNTAGRGGNFSLRKAYIELKRAPYGLRYNGLSAFTLGFCMRWVLQRNCQWTNNQLRLALDEATLAEIIEATVSEKTDKEKFICRLSNEDKAFAQKAGIMFGLNQGNELAPLETLNRISTKVEETSFKVPLWILAEYIRISRPEDKNAAEILDKMCSALKISSKGDTNARNTTMAEIGSELLQNASIIEVVAGYTKPDVYISAFRYYVDNAKPELSKIAKQVEDNSHEYCDMILKKAAPVAGWLWNKSDISSLIEQVYYSYQVMFYARSFLRLSGFVNYEEVKNRLLDKLSGFGLPYRLVGEKYPFVTRLVTYLTEADDPKSIFETLKEGKDVLDSIYNDPQRKIAIEMIRSLTGTFKLDDAILFTILGDLPSNARFSASMSTDSYEKLVRELIDQNVRNNIITTIYKEWERITGYSSAELWTEGTKLPIWTVFASNENENLYVGGIRNPKKLTTETLEEICEGLKMLPSITVKQCQDMFMQRVVPAKYKKLKIEIRYLLKFIEKREKEADPNEWPESPDISQFINEQYQEVFSQDVLNRIRKEDPEVLKNMILKIAETDPDIGLRFLE